MAASSAPAPLGASLGASPIVPYESKTKAKLATLNGDVDYKKVRSQQQQQQQQQQQ